MLNNYLDTGRVSFTTNTQYGAPSIETLAGFLFWQSVKDNKFLQSFQEYQKALPATLTQKTWLEDFKNTFPELKFVYTTNNDPYMEDMDSSSEAAHRYVFMSDQVAVELAIRNASSNVTVVGFGDSDTMNRLEEFSKRTLVARTSRKGTVYTIGSTDAGLDFLSIGNISQSLTRDNYTSKVLFGYDRILKSIQEKNKGGLAILSGPPGSGKTYLVRGMLHDLNNVINIIVPANMIEAITRPDVIPAFINLKDEHPKLSSIVLYLEDADECLAPRQTNNMSAISSILNLGDGILGQLLNINIVATTNASHQELDPAITRPGRLISHITVDTLDREQAKIIYTRLTQKPADKLDKKQYTLAEVYQLANDAEWENGIKPQNKLGF